MFYPQSQKQRARPRFHHSRLSAAGEQYEPRTKGKQFYAYVLLSDRTFRGTIRLHDAWPYNDAGAIDYARKWARGIPVEVWRGPELVTRLEGLTSECELA